METLVCWHLPWPGRTESSKSGGRVFGSGEKLNQSHRRQKLWERVANWIKRLSFQIRPCIPCIPSCAPFWVWTGRHRSSQVEP